MKTDRTWGLDVQPVYAERESFNDGVMVHWFESVLKHVRVAVTSGSREVIVFHAVKPEPESLDPEENYVFSYKRMVDPYNNPNALDLNPFAQLIADAELGRKVREAGLELK